MACKFLYVVQQYVCRTLWSESLLSFNDGALRETGKWKEECLRITLLWHVPTYACWKFNIVSWRRIAKICNLYFHCHGKIKPLEERMFPLFVVLLLQDQYPAAQSRNNPLGLAPTKQRDSALARAGFLNQLNIVFLEDQNISYHPPKIKKIRVIYNQQYKIVHNDTSDLHQHSVNSK